MTAPWPINLRGYPGDDPLDRLSTCSALLLHMAVTAVLSTLLVIVIINVLHVVTFLGPWLEVVEVIAFTLLAAPLMLGLRKSSSLVLFGIVLLPLVALDIYLEAHCRLRGLPALWDYVPGSFVAQIQPGALRSLATQSVDALLEAPLALWVSRLLTMALVPATPATEKAGPLPFPSKWTVESVPKPHHGGAFWILRILGLGYLGYLVLLLLGGLGPGAFPRSLAELFEFTFVNPYLAMNTAGKICLMTALATVGAFNLPIRRWAAFGLLVGHLISVGSSLLFYFTQPATSPHHQFLLASAIVDAAMVVMFIWIIATSPALPTSSANDDELPTSFSLPTLGWRVVLIVGAVYSAAVVILSLLGRLDILRIPMWTDLFTTSDPALGNSLALHSTVCALCILMAWRKKLRTSLVGTLSFSLGAATLLGFVLLVTGHVTVNTAQGGVNLQPLLLLHLVGFGVALATLSGLRTLSFNVEYAVTSFRASGAQAIAAMHDSLFGTDDRSDVLQAVDRFAGTIRGRKRGLLSFPFWLVERLFPIILGARPAYSCMSPDEALYFLRTYLIRPEEERARSVMPVLANVAYELSVAAQSVVLFAAYAGLSQHEKIGYVPPGARERLQAPGIATEPPGAQPAQLPRDDTDPLNWPPVPVVSVAARRIPAPRVSTPVREPSLPDEADYVVVGSGPGGAVAAYRLACKHPEARIVVLESGARYSPLQDFNERELEMVAKVYKEGGVQQTRRADMMILQGECVGGGSVINNAVCFRMPTAVRATWEREMGLPLTGLDEAYDQIARELGIGVLKKSGINRKVAATFQKAVDGLNRGGPPVLHPPTVVDVNGPDATGDGLWNLGNKYFGKRSVLETFIPWAEARGVQVVPNSTAVSLQLDKGRAKSVLVHTVGGDLVRVKANRAVVVAGGVIASSQLFMQSGVKLPVGQGMSCNFAMPAIFDFDEPMHAFDGEQITLGARDLQDRVIFETYFNPPGAFALTVPFYFDRHQSVMKRYAHLINFGALVGSESNGKLDRQLSPITGQSFEWTLGADDQRNLIFALETLLQLGQSAGAIRAILPTRPGLEFRYGADQAADLTRALGARPLRLEDFLINSAHPQGGNLMAAAGSKRERDRVVDESGRVIGLENVYVTDASVFPTSLTVNPQWTIMALSSLVADRIP